MGEDALTGHLCREWHPGWQGQCCHVQMAMQKDPNWVGVRKTMLKEKTLLTNKPAHITCWETQVGRRDTAKRYYRKRLLDGIVYLRINVKTSQLMLSLTTVRYSNGMLRSVQNRKLRTRHLHAPARILEALAINSRLPGKSSLLLHFFYIYLLLL